MFRDRAPSVSQPMKTLNLKFAATLAALSLFSLSAVSALAETGTTNTLSTNAPALKHTAKPKAEKKPKADDKTADAPAKVAKAYPFHGTVSAVDKRALTITLEGKEKARVITVGSKTVLEKDGKPATFSQIAVGDYAKGRLEKDGEHEVLIKGSFGLAPEKKAPEAAPAKPAKKTKADKKPAAPATGTNAPAPAALDTTK